MPSRLTVVLVSLLLATPVMIFWLWLLILPTSVAVQCPEKCWCEEEGYYVNCSGSGLNSIPSIHPKHIRVLVLDGNNIPFFGKDNFLSKGLVELEVIIAESCKIKKIEVGAFNGLSKLEHLSMYSNEITEITPGTFEKISHLEHLDFSHNRIEHLEVDVFYGLDNLKDIYLQGNKLQYLHPDTFKGLHNLQRLLLSKNSGLQMPTHCHFMNSLSLKRLEISSCNISSVSVETFANVSELEQLDLSYNNLRSLDINILKVLPNLSHLYLESNEITEIKPGTCEKISPLEYLFLEYNMIKHLEIDVFCGFFNLKYLYLQGNKLQYLHPDTFIGLPNLQVLFLSNNSGLQVPTHRHFINSLSLKKLEMSGCNISSVSVDTFANVSALELLDMSYNYLRSVDFNILKVLPKLTHLYLESNEIIEITPGTCEKISPLEYLSLEYNMIEHLEINVFCVLVNLKYIYLEGNNLQYLHSDTFIGLPNLQVLFSSNNPGLQMPTHRHFLNSLSLESLKISGCNIRSVSVDTFAKVTALEELDLSYNYLGSVDFNILKVLPKLTHLSLESNEMNEIVPGVFGDKCLLECLDMDSNRIEYLGIDVFYGFVNLKYIYLKGNNLQYLHPETFVGLPNLQSLYLSKNIGLQIPTDRHFISSLSLKKLEISGCNISSVSVATFTNVTELAWLDLSYNYLRSVDLNILKVLPKLSHLYLESNKINEIIPRVFGNNSLLEYLDLDNNKIEHLGVDVFYGLVTLKDTYLQGNKLQYLHPETFVGLPNLQSLYLSKNVGLQIPTDSHFITSHSLKHLHISNCNISSVSVETFANVTALERLDLSYNSLRNLDISILKALPKLSTLYLYGNPLQCDCQLQTVWRWCQDHNIETAYEGMVPECDTPSEVKGIWWGVFEKGQCLQGIIHYYGDYKNIRYRYTHIEVTDTDMDTDEDADTKRELITEILKWKKFVIFLDNYKIPICAVLFIFGTTGNVIIIIIITCNKDMRTVPNMYILNLAISDIIYLTVLFSEALPNSAKWLGGDIMCIFLPFCFHMSISLTAYSIAVLGFQRYRVTVHPLHVRFSSQPTWRATGATICGVWIVAALFAIPSVRTKDFCRFSLFLWLSYYKQRVAIFRLLVSCVLPLCVIAFFYIMMSCHLLKSRYSLSEETQNARLNTRKNAAKVMLGLTLVFLFSYLPYQIFETYYISSINLEIPVTKMNKLRGFEYLSMLTSLLDIFLSINSCLNPVALFCTSLAFRRHFKRYLTCCWKSKSTPTDFELKRRK